MSNNWRPLIQPNMDSFMNGFGGSGGGGGGGRPAGGRSITKRDPTPMFPQGSGGGSGNGFQAFGGSNNGFSGSGGGGGGSSYNNGYSPMQKMPPTNGFDNFLPPTRSNNSYSNNSYQRLNSSPIQGVGYGMSLGNRFGQQQRNNDQHEFGGSVSMQDQYSPNSNGFSRQMSNGAPPGASGDPMGFGMFGGRGGRESPPSSYKQDAGAMKIGTWNESKPASQTNGFGNSDFEIGTFNMPSSSSTSNHRNDSEFGGHFNQNGSTVGPQAGLGIRETGIIEKLLHSYGFIQCCDRQARLFFHFSQFDGNIEHLKIGDPVEFEMTYDRRTGKPIASAVSKIAPEVVMSEERVIGTVTTEAAIDPETRNESHGRISYENRGECFFLPFTTSDVEGNVTVTPGDKVSFQVATMQRSGNLVARTIRLENPTAPVKYQGVVNSVKDSFGFIERADVVKEIFFHFSESKEDIQLGDDVEFTIQTRGGKEVAANITKLPNGTVVFEDVGTEYFTGQVLKPIDRAGKYTTSQEQQEALPGRVKYRGQDRSEVEVPFGEKDQVGDFTLRHGDWIKFVIAVDRRDKLKRATKIELLEQSFQVSDERREQGVIQSIKDGFGFMRCADRDARMFFHFSECLDVQRTIQSGDECEFTVSSDPTQPGRLLALRIKHLPPGSVKFDIIIRTGISGKVVQEPSSVSWSPRSPSRSDSPSKEGAGRILYEIDGLNLEIPLYAKDTDLRNTPHLGDKVLFDINQNKATKETNAVNLKIVETTAAPPVAAPASPTASPVPNKTISAINQQGYIAALKDGFGFIETLEHDKEIFFHFSNVDGKSEKLEVGMEVEYTIYNREKGGKVSAENVKMLTKKSIPALKAIGDVMSGKVVRPLRSVNPDQDQYCGLVQVKSEEGEVLNEYEFGIASLMNKKDMLQVNDPVEFQVAASGNFCANVKATREKLRAYVEAVKGQFGFLSYEVDEGKKLFFHMSEVEGGAILQQGDEVEFVVVTNKRSGKHSACCVRKLSSSQRPERLISRLKTLNLEESARTGKRLTVTRNPRGPDGTKGFKPRVPKESRYSEISAAETRD